MSASFQPNRRAFISHQGKKTVSRCHICLINTGVENRTTFKNRLELWPPFKSKCCYSNTCLHCLKHAVSLYETWDLWVDPTSQKVTLHQAGKAYHGVKNSSLLCPFVSYEEYEVLWIRPRICKWIQNSSIALVLYPSFTSCRRQRTDVQRWNSQTVVRQS